VSWSNPLPPSSLPSSLRCPVETEDPASVAEKGKDGWEKAKYYTQYITDTTATVLCLRTEDQKISELKIKKSILYYKIFFAHNYIQKSREY
jgi:hypothetical protein